MVAGAVVVQDCAGYDQAAAHTRRVLQDTAGPVQASKAGLHYAESPLDNLSRLRQAVVVLHLLLLLGLAEGRHEPWLEGVTCISYNVANNMRFNARMCISNALITMLNLNTTYSPFPHHTYIGATPTNLFFFNNYVSYFSHNAKRSSNACADNQRVGKFNSHYLIAPT